MFWPYLEVAIQSDSIHPLEAHKIPNQSENSREFSFKQSVSQMLDYNSHHPEVEPNQITVGSNRWQQYLSTIIIEYYIIMQEEGYINDLSDLDWLTYSINH